MSLRDYGRAMLASVALHGLLAVAVFFSTRTVAPPPHRDAPTVVLGPRLQRMRVSLRPMGAPVEPAALEAPPQPPAPKLVEARTNDAPTLHVDDPVAAPARPATDERVEGPEGPGAGTAGGADQPGTGTGDDDGEGTDQATDYADVRRAVPTGPPPDVVALVHARLLESAERCYPSAARRFHQGGTVDVSFCLEAAGAVTSLGLLGSTGSDALDRAARECVVAGAAPFPGDAVGHCFRVPVRFGH